MWNQRKRWFPEICMWNTVYKCKRKVSRDVQLYQLLSAVQSLQANSLQVLQPIPLVSLSCTITETSHSSYSQIHSNQGCCGHCIKTRSVDRYCVRLIRPPPPYLHLSISIIKPSTIVVRYPKTTRVTAIRIFITPGNGPKKIIRVASNKEIVSVRDDEAWKHR